MNPSTLSGAARRRAPAVAAAESAPATAASAATTTTSTTSTTSATSATSAARARLVGHVDGLHDWIRHGRGLLTDYGVSLGLAPVFCLGRRALLDAMVATRGRTPGSVAPLYTALDYGQIIGMAVVLLANCTDTVKFARRQLCDATQPGPRRPTVHLEGLIEQSTAPDRSSLRRDLNPGHLMRLGLLGAAVALGGAFLAPGMEREGLLPHGSSRTFITAGCSGVVAAVVVLQAMMLLEGSRWLLDDPGHA